MCQSSFSLAPSVGPVWAFGGSRRLSPAGAELAGRAALALLRSGAGLVVGCCVGADARALSVSASAGLAGQVSILSAFGSLCVPGRWPLGACPFSAVAEVRRAVSAGASLCSWAGGGARVPLSARLAGRTRAVAQACTAGALVVLAPGSRGSLMLARQVAARGLPVFAVPAGNGALPVLAESGAWSRSELAGFTCFRWR